MAAAPQFTSDVVIGLEIHVQLDTNTKLFCGCATKPADLDSDAPNTRTCEVCLGLPGGKPVLNKRVVDFALKLCLALGCKIDSQLIFSRKSYFYPDLAKNYQISQFERPLGLGGEVVLSSGKKVGITRVHIEEDPASLVHTEKGANVLADYNRSGIPLCEIVTEPDMTDPEEAREFMKRLRAIIDYIGIFDDQTGVIKADANISIKESGYVRSEIKNVTGFKEIERALFYEVDRQKKAVEDEEPLIPDTRQWNAERGTTTRMRTKETEMDYGYILDPNLCVTNITKKWIKQEQDSIPELPDAKEKRFVKELGIEAGDAAVIAQEKRLAELFEKTAEKVDPVLASRWLRRELTRVMNYNKIGFDNLKIDHSHLIELLSMVEKKEISDPTAKKIMEELMADAFSPCEYVKKHGLEVVSDSGEIEKWCKEAIAANQKAVDEFKAGNEKSFNFLVGQVMRASKGKASPQEVSKILRELLENK